jgi:hypothetical protein
MATGAVFQLINNDGKSDRMILATELLNKRLAQIERLRAQNPRIKDPTPTLVDIEKTHIVFVNSHFKPYAAIAYEYQRQSINSGQARLGGTMQFSIPQFGDFFSDMVLHLQLESVTAVNAAYWSDPVTSPAEGAELLAYVNFPAQALVTNVQFSVNGNPLDQYDSSVMNFHEKFFVTPHKRVGWNKSMGQELPKPGFTDITSSNKPGEIYQFRGAGVREAKAFLDGPQTPKVTQPALDLWIPLLFWFNKDPRLSVPSVAIPYGQRYINVTLAQASSILQHVHAYDPALDAPGNNPVPTPSVLIADLYINNLFVNPEIHDIYIKRIGFSLIRVHRHQSIRSAKADDQLLLQNLKWPIETIYCGARPTDNFDTSSSDLLTRWNQYSHITTVEVDECCIQNGYSWDASLVAPLTATVYTASFVSFTGIALDFATVLGVAGGTVLTVNQLNLALVSSGYPPMIGTFVDPDVPTAAEIIAAVPPTNCVSTYDDAVAVFETITLTAQGIYLYNALPSAFFNQYVPYTYGNTHVQTPSDPGAYMITFNLYPGAYQPSGYINISRSREFYLNYHSTLIGSLTVPEVEVTVIAIALNFLLISDGSAVLRYAT